MSKVDSIPQQAWNPRDWQGSTEEQIRGSEEILVWVAKATFLLLVGWGAYALAAYLMSLLP